MYKLAVGHTADSRNIEVCFFCNVFQDHRLEVGLVAGEEEVVLVIHDRGHCRQQCMLALFDSIDEPFGCVDLLFDEKNSFFLTFIFFGTTVVLFHHVAVAFADAELGSVAAVEREFEFTAIVEDEKIGDHVAFGLVDLADVSTGFGVEFDDLLHYGLQFLVVQTKTTLDFFVMLLGKLIEIFLNSEDRCINVLTFFFLTE